GVTTVRYPAGRTGSKLLDSRCASDSGNMRRLPAPVVAVRGALAVAFGLIGAAGFTSTAAAPPCSAGAGRHEALAGIDGELRLRWIEARRSRTAHHARLWTRS